MTFINKPFFVVGPLNFFFLLFYIPLIVLVSKKWRFFLYSYYVTKLYLIAQDTCCPWSLPFSGTPFQFCIDSYAIWNCISIKGVLYLIILSRPTQADVVYLAV